MPAGVPLWQAVLAHVEQVTAGRGVRRTVVRRLALLVTGMVAAQSTVVARIAAELVALGVSEAQESSIARRIRRTLHDTRWPPATIYLPAVRAAGE